VLRHGTLGTCLRYLVAARSFTFSTNINCRSFQSSMEINQSF